MKTLAALVVMGALLAGCSSTDTGSRSASNDDKGTMTGSRIPKSNSGSKTADPQAVDELMRSRNTMRPGTGNN
jgi:outer membrane murein-binding lipoprotein Lpp